MDFLPNIGTLAGTEGVASGPLWMKKKSFQSVNWMYTMYVILYIFLEKYMIFKLAYPRFVNKNVSYFRIKHNKLISLFQMTPILIEIFEKLNKIFKSDYW